MKKYIIMAVIMVTIIGGVFLGVDKVYSGKVVESNDNQQLELVKLAMGKGATRIEVAEDSVSYSLDGLHHTVYSYSYGIKELKGSN